MLMTAILIGVALGGCSVGRFDALSVASGGVAEGGQGGNGTRSLAPPAAGRGDQPTPAGLPLPPLAGSAGLTKGDKDSSQPWENPSTGARGSVTPLASAYSAEGRTCRDFLASYVNGTSESWLHGAACRAEDGAWEIRRLKPWKQS